MYWKSIRDFTGIVRPGVGKVWGSPEDPVYRKLCLGFSNHSLSDELEPSFLRNCAQSSWESV